MQSVFMYGIRTPVLSIFDSHLHKLTRQVDSAKAIVRSLALFLLMMMDLGE